MSRRIICTVLALLMLGNVAVAETEIGELYRRMPGAQWNEAGEWSGHDRYTEQMLRMIETGMEKPNMSTGSCLVYVDVRGDDMLGLCEAVLNVCLFRSTPLKGDGLSIVAGGTRYDFVASPRAERLGSFPMERFELPLDQNGMRLLKDMQEGFSLAIHGGSRAYRVTVDDAAQEFEQHSRELLRHAWELLESEDALEYQLWDRNESRWPENRAAMSCTPLDEFGHALLDDEFGLLRQADRTAVMELQQMLYEQGFYSGKIDGQYGAGTRQAIRAAQRYYGFLETGQADGHLLSALEGVSVELPVPETASGDVQIVEGVAEIRIDRHWIARKVVPSKASQDCEDTLVPVDRDNVLFVADGEISNLGEETLLLPLHLQATLIIDEEYRFSCTIRCEQDGGMRFGMRVLPRGKQKIVICAEIPIKMEMWSWCVQFE